MQGYAERGGTMSAGDRYEGGDRSPGASTRVALVDPETGRRRGTVSLDLEGLLAAARSLNEVAPGATTKPPEPNNKGGRHDEP